MPEINDLTVSLPLLLAGWLGVNVLGFVLAKVLRTHFKSAILSEPSSEWKVLLWAWAPLLALAIPLILLMWSQKQIWPLAGLLPLFYAPLFLGLRSLEKKDFTLFDFRPSTAHADDLNKALWVLGNVFLAFKMVTNEAAKSFDISWGYQLTFAVFLCFVFGILFNLKDLWQAAKLHKPSPLGLGILALLLIGFGLFAVKEIPLQHRVLSDESSWESMGLQMTYAPWSEKGSVCNQGIFDEKGKLECFDRVNNFKGKLTPFVYDLSAYFTQPSRDSALWVNLPIYLLSLALMFYAVLILHGKESTALISVVFLGAMPTMLFQARAASTEVLYTLLFNLALVVFGLLLPRFKMRHLWLVLPLLGLFAGTRLDTVFCFGAVYFVLWKFLLERPNRLWWFTLGLVLCCLPSITVIAAYKGYDFQGGQYDAFSLYNFFVNFSTNLQVMLGLETDYDGMWKWPFMTTQTVILYLGAIYLIVQAALGQRYRMQVITALIFFVQAILIMVNVSGNFTIDINQRYVLVTYPLFAMISAYFLSDLRDRFFANNKSESKHFWFTLGASLLGIYAIIELAVNQIAKSKALAVLKNAGTISDTQPIASDLDLRIEMQNHLGKAWENFGQVQFFVWIFAAIALVTLIHFYKKRTISKQAWLLLSFVIALNGSLLWAHHDQFEANIMYRHNGLLIEEKFLNEELRKLPNGSVFVYARPWQMLCSRLNGISEDRLLSWSPQEWAQWFSKTGGNIYLVRGQDAWGDLNRGGRVVGFKTTQKAEQVLERFEYEEVLTNSELFGYPLTVYKLKSYKGINPYRSQLIFKAKQNDISSPNELSFEIQKFFAQNVGVEILNSKDQVLASYQISQNGTWQPKIQLAPGMNELRIRYTYPDGKNDLEWLNVFVRSGGAKLLTDFEPSQHAQEWGKPEKNHTVNSNPLKVKSRTYDFGLGTHAQSDIHYDLGGQFAQFQTSCGLDDEDMGGDGVIFRIFGDGKLLWESKPMFSGETQSIQVPVTGVKDLHLQVDRRGNKDFDHADWLNSWFMP